MKINLKTVKQSRVVFEFTISMFEVEIV